MCPPEADPNRRIYPAGIRPFGPNSDQPPTETDLKIARELGKRVAEVAKKLKV
ncbi:MAG: hypothetical protein HY998_02170 [candidate division NC10 bacterium]|nr:hypothetical protein [candidate division NC10 bacterium]